MIDPASDDRFGRMISIGEVRPPPRSPLRWHLLALAMLRRWLVQTGADPSEVEATLGGDGKRSHVGLVKSACERLRIESTLDRLTTPDLRRIARLCATLVNLRDDRHDHYPDGWRRAYEEIREATVLATEPTPPAREREPGDDDE